MPGQLCSLGMFCNCQLRQLTKKMRFLSAVPLPLRLILVFLLIVMTYKILGSGLSLILLPLMLVLCALTVTTLMYEFGWLNWVSGMPVLAGFYGFMTNRQGSQSDEGSRGELSDEDRLRLYEKGASSLRSLIGAEAVEAEIYERFVYVAKDNPDQPFATQAPAVLGIFAGPRGVGKTTTVNATAHLLAGCNALLTSKIVTLRDTDLRSGQYSSATALGTQKAKEAIDGALVLDDADWLVQEDAYGSASGVDLGIAILDVILQYKGRIWIALTISHQCLEKLLNDPGHNRWLGKLTIKTIRFEHFEEEVLSKVLEQHLSRSGWTLEDESTKQAALRLLKEKADRAGPSFDNAEACRRAAESLMEIATQEYTQEDALRSKKSISREIVTIVDEELS